MNVVKVVFFLVCLQATSLVARADCRALDSIEASKVKQNKKEITFLSNSADASAAYLLAKWFNEKTGVSVRVKVVPHELVHQVFLDDVNSKTPTIDIAEIWHPTIAELAEKGAIANLTEFIYSHRELILPKDFFPKMYDAYTLYKGLRWAIPYDVDTHFLFYRPSLLKKYKFPPPQTWGDVQKIAETITKNEKVNGIYGIAIMGFPSPLINVSTFLNRLSALGGEFINQQGEVGLTKQEGVLALQLMIDIAPYALPTPVETDYEVSRDAFLSGRVAMVEQWSNVGSFAADAKYSSIIGDWSLVPMPRKTESGSRQSIANLNAGFSIVMSKHAPNSEMAKDFLLFISCPDIQKRLNLENIGIDVGRLSVANSNEYMKLQPKMARETAKAFSGGVATWPNHPKVHKMMELLSVSISKVMVGEETAQLALEKIQQQWETILDEDN